MQKKQLGVFFAILAAALYALNAPFSKLLLSEIPPRTMAALLYLGAGLGMALVGAVQKRMHITSGAPGYTRADLPFVLGMIVLDIAAPIFLMTGLSSSCAASVSLLNNFEIVATALIALLLFGEAVSRRLWTAIGFVTLACALLSVEDAGSLTFSMGSVFVLLACVCWGFENNCTRKLSDKGPLFTVVIKGIGSGFGALLISLFIGERICALLPILGALLLGFVAYGLSIFFYIRAQSILGAAKTSTYYAVSPFIGSYFSLVLYKTIPSALFLLALSAMIAGTYLATTDGN